MTRSTYFFCKTAVAALCATVAQAQNDDTSSVFGSVIDTPNVVLTQNDGSASKTGQLLGFENGFFTLLTDDTGTIRVSAGSVTCEGAGCPDGTAPDGTAEEVQSIADVKAAAGVRVTGSDTVGLQLMPSILEDYSVFMNSDASTKVLSEFDADTRYLRADGSKITNVFVDSAGNSEGLAALADGTTDFSMNSRPPSVSEKELIVGNGLLRGSDNETVIAMDSLATVVHPNNPIDALTLAQIGAIYAGEITNWSEVGGPDASINVVSRDGGSTRGIFENAIFSGEERDLGEDVLQIEGDHPEMAALVREDPNAIGYVSLIFTEGLKGLALTSSCGITSTANAFDIKTEQYPLVRRLYLYNGEGALSNEQQQFLSYVLSPAVDDAVTRSGFVNFAVTQASQKLSDVDIEFDRIPTAADTRLVNQLTDDLALWDRLSTTIRFPTGSSTLGNKELNDINRLIAYLEDLPEGTRVATVGFADDIGSFDTNISLSGRRAASVASQIATLAGSRLDNIAFEPRAYGELSPAVCNLDESGRSINRRVEVWVRN